MAELDAGWISTGILLEKGFVFSPFMMYSPSKRYAMMWIHQWLLGDWLHTIVIVDLYNNTSRQLQREEWTNVCYWYWLDETTISVFNEDTDDHYSHYVYSYDVNNQEAKLELIRKNRIAYCASTGNRYNHNNVRKSTNCVNRIILDYQEYLLVRTYEGILCPYDITARGPFLPPLKIKQDVHSKLGNYIFCDLGYSFAYKKSIYFCVAENSVNRYRYSLKSYIKLDFLENDLIERQAIMEDIPKFDTNDTANLKKRIFHPKVLNEGLYKNYMTEGSSMWQDGPIILLSNALPKGSRLIWILNLEEETIMEHKIDIEFTCATIYRGFLHLWTTVRNESNNAERVVSKFVFLRYSVPKLSDFCTIRMISQRK